LKLDAGCGFSDRTDLSKGEYAFNPSVFGDDVVYLDIGKPEGRIRKIGNWVVADAYNLPFRDESFEMVYASHVVEHLPNPKRFLGEARRVMKKKGQIIIKVPNFISKNATEDPSHLHVFSPFSLRRLLKESGFKPHFGANIAAKIPRILRVFLKAVNVLLCDELVMVGEKG